MPAPHDDDALTLADTLTAEDLADALRAQAQGGYGTEAAVELLIRYVDPFGHGWIHRREFRACIDVGPSFTTPEVVMAAIDWDTLRNHPLAGSSTDMDILNIARTLAGQDPTEPLSLAGLDDTNRELVLRAMLHAARGADAPPVTVHPFPRHGT